MKVKEIMTKKVIKIKKDATLEEAAEILAKNEISGAPVVGKKNKLVGIISEKDLFRAFYPDFRDIITDLRLWLSREKRRKRKKEKKKKISISKIMTRNLITVDIDASLIKVGSIMLVNKVSRLPVIRNGKMVGIITRRDIFRRLLEEEMGI